jgi:hypothetical protein
MYQASVLTATELHFSSRDVKACRFVTVTAQQQHEGIQLVLFSTLDCVCLRLCTRVSQMKTVIFFLNLIY